MVYGKYIANCISDFMPEKSVYIIHFEISYDGADNFSPRERFGSVVVLSVMNISVVKTPLNEIHHISCCEQFMSLLSR